MTALWVWRHASRHGLTNPSLDVRVVEGIGRRLGLSAVVFGLSIPLAWLNATAAYVLWIGMFGLLLTTDWLSWQQAIMKQTAAIPLDGATRARIRMQHGGGRLSLRADAAAPGLLQGVFGGGVDRQISRSGEALDVQLKVAARQGFMSLRFPWAWGPADILDWSVALNQQIPMALDIETGGGQAILDLEALHVTALDIHTGASSMQIGLPAHAGHSTVRIEAGTASLVLHVPPNVAARIQTTKNMANAEIDVARFPMVAPGREYRSLDFDEAVDRVDIQLEVAICSVVIG
jgi:hypothetical protein